MPTRSLGNSDFRRLRESRVSLLWIVTICAWFSVWSSEPAFGQDALTAGVGAYVATIGDATSTSTLALSAELGVRLSENYHGSLRGVWWNTQRSRLALGAYYGGRLPMNRHFHGEVGLALVRVGTGATMDNRVAIAFGLGWIIDLSRKTQLRLLTTYLRDKVEPTYGLGASLAFLP